MFLVVLLPINAITILRTIRQTNSVKEWESTSLQVGVQGSVAALKDVGKVGQYIPTPNDRSLADPEYSLEGRT